MNLNLCKRQQLVDKLNEAALLAPELCAALPVVGDEGSGRWTLITNHLGSDADRLLLTPPPETNLFHFIVARYEMCMRMQPSDVANMLADRGVRWVFIANANTLGAQGLQMIGSLANGCSTISDARNRPIVVFTASSIWDHLFAGSGAKVARFHRQHFLGNVNAQYLNAGDTREILTNVLPEESAVNLTDKQLENIAKACRYRIADVIRIATAVKCRIYSRKQMRVTYGMLLEAVQMCGAGRGSPASDVLERTFHAAAHVVG